MAELAESPAQAASQEAIARPFVKSLYGQLAGHVVNVGITYGVYGGKLLSAPERLALIERLDFGVDLSHLEPAG
ncbi:hypothetical protein [Azospirillum brasilense]|uniref:hypothetical protein n=1 Tax=Azospirillum brasilense TaxID=192 RepID=UPI0011A8A70B|nr:hypothetical protein [Azospirillum brasilense]